MMKVFLLSTRLLPAVLLVCASGWAAPKATALPADLVALEKKYVRALTLEASFAQTSESAMTGTRKETTGVIMVKHPNQIRWETLTPDQNLLVGDGTKYWFYTPPFEDGERGQVVIKKTGEVQSQVASLLLSGSFSKVKGLKVEKTGPNLYRLIFPAGAAGGVKDARIEIDPKALVIQAVKLEYDGGNKSDIRLSKVKLGAKMDPGFFRFTTPPSTDVITE